MPFPRKPNRQVSQPGKCRKRTARRSVEARAPTQLVVLTPSEVLFHGHPVLDEARLNARQLAASRITADLANWDVDTTLVTMGTSGTGATSTDSSDTKGTGSATTSTIAGEMETNHAMEEMDAPE